MLLETLRRPLLPIVRLMRKAREGQGESPATNHLLPFMDGKAGGPLEEPSHAVWVDNWIRLGLVEVDYSRHLVAEQSYSWVDDRPEFTRLVNSDDRGQDSVNVGRGILRTTDFGGRFLAAVSFDGIPPADPQPAE